jgi:hypothetical protein
MLSIDPALAAFMPPPIAASDAELERQIVAEGRACDPIVVWKEKGVIIDGHRRHRICTKLGLPFETREVSLGSLDDAKREMASIAVARRNLSPIDFTKMIGEIGNYEKSKGPGWAERTAEQAGVNKRTVFRAAKSAESLKLIPEELHDRLRQMKATREDITALSEYEPIHQRTIVAAVEDGEFFSLRHALEGEEDNAGEPEEWKEEAHDEAHEDQEVASDDELGDEDSEEIDENDELSDSVSPESSSFDAIAAKKSADASIKALGHLMRETRRLAEAHHCGRLDRVVRELLEKVGFALEEWKQLTQ